MVEGRVVAEVPVVVEGRVEAEVPVAEDAAPAVNANRRRAISWSR